jgi:hypothetical protein
MASSLSGCLRRDGGLVTCQLRRGVRPLSTRRHLANAGAALPRLHHIRGADPIPHGNLAASHAVRRQNPLTQVLRISPSTIPPSTPSVTAGDPRITLRTRAGSPFRDSRQVENALVSSFGWRRREAATARGRGGPNGCLSRIRLEWQRMIAREITSRSSPAPFRAACWTHSAGSCDPSSTVASCGDGLSD